MLGCLKMSIDDCIVTFQELCTKIYTPVDPLERRRSKDHQEYNPNKFDSRVLEEAVKEMIRTKSDLTGEEVFEQLNTKCKV